MNGPILDEFLGTIKQEGNRHPIPRRYTTETVIGTLIVMVLYVGIILAFLSNF